MARVVFITDQHLCRESRWVETERLMEWCWQKFAELKPDVIAFGGDLWDRKPDVSEMKATAAWVARLADIAPVVGVRGNHDPVGISMLNLLEAKHPIRFAEQPEVQVYGGVSLVLLPWPLKSQLLAQLQNASAGEAQQVGVAELCSLVRGLGMVAEFNRPKPTCFVGHVQLRGARVSTGQPLAPGADFELGTEDLALANCDAYLLGHIHLPADLTAGGKPCLMGGSFRRTAYGEVEEKSVVVVDFDDGDHTAFVQRLPIPCAPMFLVEEEWGADPSGHDTWLAGLHGEPRREELHGAEVRFRYYVAADKREAARAAAEHVKSYLFERGAVHVKVDEQVRPVNTARAPEVAQAQTLEAKLGAYWTARGTQPEPERADRLLSMAHQLEVAGEI